MSDLEKNSYCQMKLVSYSKIHKILRIFIFQISKSLVLSEEKIPLVSQMWRQKLKSKKLHQKALMRQN